MKYRGILFDLDGTLLDTSDLIIKSFQHTFRVHHNRDIAPEEVRIFFGKTLRAAMETLAPENTDEVIQTYRKYNLEYHDQLAKIFTGVLEVLQSLYNAGVTMAIVTSKTHSTALKGLRLFDMDKYFPVVIGVEQCQNHKPHPEPVHKALSELGLNAEVCLMVGDSPFDLISAREAGVKTAAVRWTQVPWNSVLAERPDYVLDDMHNLLDILGIDKQN